MRLANRRTLMALGIMLIVLLILAALASQRAARADAWQEIVDRGAVRIAMDASYPPFESIDEQGVVSGLDVDLARALGERWGVEMEFVNIAFDGLYDALLARKADMILSALPYDDLLTRDVIYSQAYFAGGQVIVAPSTAYWITSELDLRDGIVAVELGAEGHALISRLNRDRGLGIRVLALPDVASAAGAVESGQAVAMICDRVDALRLAANGALEIVGEPLTVDPYVIAVRIDSPRLAQEIAAALDALSAEGKLEALQTHWLEQPSEP